MSEPQSASATVVAPVTGWPSATSPVTRVPSTFPLPAPARCSAWAATATVVAVISPPKTDSVLTWADALDWAEGPASADALALAEPVLTIGAPVTGSAPYVKLPLNWTESSGALTVGVPAAGWPGT